MTESLPSFSLEIPPGAFAGYIFDCDGTLVDSMPLHWDAWRAALAAQQAPFEFTVEMHHRYAGMSIPEIVLACNIRFSVELDAVQVERDREEYFFRHIESLVPVEPVVSFARSFHGTAPMAVASGSDRRIVIRELEVLDLLDLFPVIVTASDVPRGKPFPDMFLRAAHLMGVPPARCLVFEDGNNGIEAAQAAGMASVFVPTNLPALPPAE